jgi:hypothetical protein
MFHLFKKSEFVVFIEKALKALKASKALLGMY